MNTLLLMLILLLAVAAFVISRLNRQRSPKIIASLSEPRHFAGLFAEQHTAEAKWFAQAETNLLAKEARVRLLQRASEGDQSALDDAHDNGDADLYHDVLQALVAQAERNEERLRSIAEHILDSGKLRSTSDFAEIMIEYWSSSLNQRTLTEMLYLAALADDPASFQHAVDSALKQWRAGKPSQISIKDVLAAVESAYWLISTEVRSSGSGFLLKQAIASVRRELAAATRQSA